jgi:hypothetical protein
MMPGDDIDKLINHEFDDKDYVAAFNDVTRLASERFGDDWKLGLLSIAANAAGVGNVVLHWRPTGKRNGTQGEERELVCFTATCDAVESLSEGGENEEG